MTQQTDRLTTALAGRYRIQCELGEGTVVSIRTHKLRSESARICLDAPKTEQDVRVARLMRTLAHDSCDLQAA
jgi:hypothetical protein